MFLFPSICIYDVVLVMPPGIETNQVIYTMKETPFSPFAQGTKCFDSTLDCERGNYPDEKK